jgi:hypothetical protein
MSALKGSKNQKAKVTEADVVQIRRLRSQGVTLTVLAAQYHLTIGSIAQILRRYTWRHVL